MIYNFEQIELDEALRIYSSFAKTEEGALIILNQRSFLPLEEIDKRQKLIKILENFEDENLFEISELKIILEPLIKDYNYLFSEKELSILLKKIGYFKNLKENLKKLENELLDDFISSIFDPEPLEVFERLFSDDGFLKKDATENLKKLYKKEKTLFNQIQKVLEKEIEKHRDFLSEETFMFKQERYCLPVKKSYQSKVEGVFWGISNSRETIFIEPSSLLILNNSLRSIIQEIELEKQRICAEITENIKNYLEDILKSLQTLYKIDFLNALGKFKKNFNGILPEIIDPADGIFLNESFHPILYWMKKENSSKVVPLSLSLKPPQKCLILTGPNGGGKTVTLKTVGLMVSLGLMGFPLTARDGTKIPYIKKLFISIGDAQDIEKGLSTFTSVISNLSIFLKEVDSSSFCLIDEVGFGTNPEEGAALGISILKGIAQKNPFVIASTHLDYIKFLSLEDERFANGSMAFDEVTGMPTFEFIKDIMGKSNAFAIAEKFGMPKEIIESAKNHLDKKSLELESFLEKLQILEKEKKGELEKIREERENHQRILNNIEKEREEEKEKLKNDFEKFKKSLWEKLNSEIEKLRAEGIQIGKKKEEKLILNLTSDFPFEEKKEKKDDSLKINSSVFHKTLRKKGVLRRINGEIGVIDVEGKNLWVSLNEIEKIEDKENKTEVNYLLKNEEEVRDSLNLIGKRVEDAQEEIDTFLDNSAKYGILRVKIIHGHGTGKLKRGVREYLKKHPLVSNYGAEENDGATWVELVNG